MYLYIIRKTIWTQPQVPSHTPRWLPPTMWAHFYNNPAGYINIVLPNRHCHKGSGEAPGIPGNQHNDNPSFRGSNPDNHLLHQADRTCSVIFFARPYRKLVNPPYLPQSCRQEPVLWNRSYVVYNIVFHRKNENIYPREGTIPSRNALKAFFSAY